MQKGDQKGWNCMKISAKAMESLFQRANIETILASETDPCEAAGLDWNWGPVEFLPDQERAMGTIPN